MKITIITKDGDEHFFGLKFNAESVFGNKDEIIITIPEEEVKKFR